MFFIQDNKTLRVNILNFNSMEQKNPAKLTGFLTVVRKKGLEPPRREAPDPKSGAATNYATSALGFLTGRKDSV